MDTLSNARSLSAQLARCYLSKDTPPERIAELRRELTTVNLEKQIRTAFQSTPRLLPEQRQRLIAIIKAGGR